MKEVKRKRGLVETIGIILMMTVFLFVSLSGTVMADEELNGWVEENGKWRYYDHGYMYRNRGLTEGGYTGEWADTYYFDNDGYMVTGFYRTMGGDGYYLSYFGPDGKRWQKDGWQKLDDGYWYYITNGFVCAPSTGNMFTESIATYYIDGAVYGFDVNGHVVTGWIRANRFVREYSPEAGMYLIVYEGGMPKMENSWMCFAQNGKGVTGWVQRNGNWCYCYEGLAQAGDVYQIDGNKYCFDAEGIMQTNHWIQHENTSGGTSWFYFGSDGAMVKNGWKNISGKYYYFDGESLKTGWIQANGKWYYANPSTGAMQTGVVTVGGKYYYFSKTDGTMQFGFVKDGGKYYYFSKSTGVLQTGFVKDSGKYYFFSKTNGTMQFGWVKDGGKYYYFDPANGTLKTGWLSYGGKYYYLNPATGNPVTGTQTINGRTYQFNSSGVCVG